MIDVLAVLRDALADRYTLERKLGSGGMATVYLGEDLKHHRQVAIKVLRPELAATLGAERFLREIDIAATLNHPHIIPLFDSGQAEDLIFYVMPYVEGESLRDRLKQRAAVPVREAIRYGEQTAYALDYAHQRGIIHRDIKPSNILLSAGQAVIADFGIARALQSASGEDLTASGFAVGSPIYMSPEQAWGDEVDSRSDIYSLGCVLYEMLAGEPPFKAETFQALIAKRVVEPIPSLSSARPEVSPRLAAAVETALAKTPNARHQSAAVFAEALADTDPRAVAAVPAPGRIARTRPPWLSARRLFTAVVTVGALVAAFLVIPRILQPAYAVGEPRQKLIVLPFQAEGTSPEADQVARHAEAELTRLLMGWEQVRVVPTVSKAGLMWGVGIRDDTIRASLPESIAVAREARVGTLVTLSVTTGRDSAYLEAQLYDVASRGALGDPITSSAPVSDLFALVAPVAAEILDFSGAPRQLRSFQRESNDLDAIQQVLEGRAQLERWRLESAERSFREALSEDTTFARAHYLLALTLYWQAARDVQRFPDLLGEIRRHSSAARRHGAALVPRDSLHVEALFSFLSGDYQRARTLYDDLVRGDSTDTYAWLLSGSVEFQDPWAEEFPDGRLAPRGDLNLATRAFIRTVRLSPDFFLGYGHLFDIYTGISDAIMGGRCLGKERPSDKVVLIWERRSPADQVYSCPVMRDSIEWVSRPDLAAFDKRQLVDGADRLLGTALTELRRWSEYAPDEARPAEEQVNWLLARRDLVSETGGPRTADSLVVEAVRHSERALGLKRDTTPEDLIRVGALNLGAGDLARALTVTERGIEAARVEDGGVLRELPDEAANVFLVTGRVAQALEIVVPHWERLAFSTPRDPIANRSYRVLAEGVIGRLRVYGATAFGGEPLRAAFAEIDDMWTRAGYSERQKRFIRQRTVTFRIQSALILDPNVMADWFEGWEPDDPALVGLLVAGTDPDSARRSLARSLDEHGEAPSTPIPAYLIGLLAQRTGDHDRAVQSFEQLDRLPLELRGMGVAWGLRSLSHLRRAESFEVMGDSEAARRHYSRFLELWEEADPELQPIVTEARSALARLP